MKRKILIILVAILFVISTSCAGYGYINRNPYNAEEAASIAAAHEMVADWAEYIKDKNVVTFISNRNSQYCYNCDDYLELVRKVAEEKNYEVYNLNILNYKIVDENDYKIVSDKLGDYFKVRVCPAYIGVTKNNVTLGGYDCVTDEKMLNEAFNWWEDNDYDESNNNDKYDEWLKSINDIENEKILTILSFSKCQSCNVLRKIATKYQREYNFKLYYFNGDTLSENQIDTFRKKSNYGNLLHRELEPLIFYTYNKSVLFSWHGFLTDERIKKEFISSEEEIKELNNTNGYTDEETAMEIDDSIPDCKITNIKGTEIELKNSVATNYSVLSDIYINGNFSSKIKYEKGPYTECSSLQAEKIDNEYFLISFPIGDVPTHSYNYLFNKNGKYITDFKEWDKKYAGTKGFENVHGEAYVEENGKLEIDYYAGEALIERSLDEEYCELKAKPDDIYSIIEYVSISNDKLNITNIKKVSWKEAYLCEDDEVDNCGDISKVNCDEVQDED